MQVSTFSPPSLNAPPAQDQEMIAEMIKRYGEEYLSPEVIRKLDESQEFPIDIMKDLGEMGLLGVLVPESYGGSGLGYQEYISVIVELAKFCGAIALSVAAHNSLCTNHILKFGNEAQKSQYLPKLASGEHIGAWGLTEANTGSDAGNMRTTAKLTGEYWTLNGTKNFITHGISSDIAVVIARTGEPNTRNNSTAFIVQRGTEGFKAGKKEDKLGMRASETAEMIFEDCKIHDSQRIGEIGEGFKQALKILDGGRISIAALGLGIASGAYEAALKYAKEREQFGQPIFNFQGISFKLADMATRITAGELLTRHAAESLTHGSHEVGKYSAMAKLHTSETAVFVANEAVQIHGGYGYLKDFPVEKYYRDAKLCTIGEGTSEIQRLVISRAIGK